MAIPYIRNAFPAKKLLAALNGDTGPLKEGSCCLPVAQRHGATAGGKPINNPMEVSRHWSQGLQD